MVTGASLNPGDDADRRDEGPCWICGRLTTEIDLDFEAWQHETCWFPADQQFWAACLASDVALADGVAVLL